MMENNGYIGLLKNDRILIRHPKTNKERQLYRVIALKSFQIHPEKNPGLDESSVAESYIELNTKLLSNYESEKTELLELLNNKKAALDRVKDKNDKNEILALETEIRKYDADIVSIQYKTRKIRSEISKYEEIASGNCEAAPISIPIHTIGGYVESLENLDPDNVVWVDNRSRIFDNAKILNNSIVSDNVIVFGNSVISSSKISGYSKIHEDCTISNSIVGGLSEVKGKACIDKSVLDNSAMCFGQASVENCIMKDGTIARDNSNISNTILLNTSQVHNDAVVKNSILENRSVIGDGQNDSVHLSVESSLETKIVAN